ncbi:hypothetical protein C0J52_01900 [Blattella germanica]|nr:hypothetical protein C0J52_01900 [Blattella germanica]
MQYTDETQRRYRNEFNCRVAPTAKTILCIARKLNKIGTVHNLHKEIQEDGGQQGHNKTSKLCGCQSIGAPTKDTEDMREN